MLPVSPCVIVAGAGKPRWADANKWSWCLRLLFQGHSFSMYGVNQVIPATPNTKACIAFTAPAVEGPTVSNNTNVPPPGLVDSDCA
jgi:hypothetical protein